MKKLNKKGFTLVELLAVIVILAIIMILVMNRLGDTQENAYKAALQTEAMKLVSGYETAQMSEAMIGNTAVSTKMEEIGDYSYSIKVDADGKVNKYCVIYKGKYSVYGESNPLDKPTVYNVNKAGSCTIDDKGEITVVPDKTE